MTSLVLVYALLTKLVLDFFSANGVISIVWPPSGLGLAALLLGGKKYWPGIFAGAMTGNLLAGSSIGMSIAIASGNALEAVTGFLLLVNIAGFNPKLLRLHDYFKLVFAAAACACISALNGTIALLLEGLLSQPLFIHDLIHWWQGDLLGMVLLTPLILVWRQPPQGWFRRDRIPETAAFLILAFIVGQIVFLHWLHEAIGSIARSYWMFLFVSWGALRFGRHGALLIIGMTALQSLVGAAQRVGFFGTDIDDTHLNNYWFYMLLLSTVGITLALTINERIRAEANSMRLTKLYRALSETNQAIVRMEQQSSLFPLVCHCAVEYGGMKMAWIGQIEESTGLVVPVAKAGEGLSYLDDLIISSRADVAEGRGPTGTALRESHPVIINNYQKSALTAPWQDRVVRYGWNAAATVPISHSGKSFAVLTVYHDQIDAFDDESVNLLTEMSSDISFALDNFAREQQRKIALANLEASERHYATLLSVSPVGVFETDKEGQYIYVNSRWLKITGLSLESAMGNSWMHSLHPDDREAVCKSWNALIKKGRTYHLEHRFVRPDGTSIWVLGQSVAFLSPSGTLLGYTGTITDITENKRAEELIWKQANFDLLTGLPNRIMFMDRLKQEIKKSHRANLPLALLYLDLDRFKEVNDTLGHGKGDILLKEAAQRLCSCVRDTDTVARLGGDEFTIIMSQLEDISSVERVAQNILQKLATSFRMHDEVAYVSASIGITFYPEDGTEIEALLKNADQAMYAAKKVGRNCFNYFKPSMQEASLIRMRIANDLRSALANNQLHIYYQPIVELATGNIHKAEALLRWQHPVQGMISPAEFIPIAEETGLIIDIGNWVFRQAAQQAKHWQTLYCPDFQISINTSPMQYRSDEKNHKDTSSWFKYLQQLGLSGQSVVVEITEGLLMDASDAVTGKLLEFRDAGIQVSLDDFGTGYSSLSYLKKYDIDYLKIDQSFVRNLAPASNDMVLCSAIICMAHQLDIKVIAEGIETEEQRNLLTSAGCDYGQGYLWSRPVTVEAFAGLLTKD